MVNFKRERRALHGEGNLDAGNGLFLDLVVVTKCLLYNEILYEIYMKFHNGISVYIKIINIS